MAPRRHLSEDRVAFMRETGPHRAPRPVIPRGRFPRVDRPSVVDAQNLDAHPRAPSSGLGTSVPLASGPGPARRVRAGSGRARGAALTMPQIYDLLRSNPSARRFFAAYLQSALGNGMGYVALVLVALQRFHSPWAVALIIIADLVPMMALGPLLGSAADRLPRRACAVGSDLVRAVAFA